MFTNICMGDMGKYTTQKFLKIFSYQDSDQSIPLCLALCIIEIILPTLHPITITIDNTKIVDKTILVFVMRRNKKILIAVRH